MGAREDDVYMSVCRVVPWECVRMMCTSVNTVWTALHEDSQRSNSGITQSTAGPTVSTDFYRNFIPRELTSYVSSVKPSIISIALISCVMQLGLISSQIVDGERFAYYDVAIIRPPDEC